MGVMGVYGVEGEKYIVRSRTILASEVIIQTNKSRIYSDNFILMSLNESNLIPGEIKNKM